MNLIKCYDIAIADQYILFRIDLTNSTELSPLAKSEISLAQSEISRSQTAQSVMDSEEVLRAPSTTRNYQTAADEEEYEEPGQEAKGRKLKRNKISKKVNVSKKTVKGGNNSNYHVIRF